MSRYAEALDPSDPMTAPTCVAVEVCDDCDLRVVWSAPGGADGLWAVVFDRSGDEVADAACEGSLQQHWTTDQVQYDLTDDGAYVFADGAWSEIAAAATGVGLTVVADTVVVATIVVQPTEDGPSEVVLR